MASAALVSDSSNKRKRMAAMCEKNTPRLHTAMPTGQVIKVMRRPVRSRVASFLLGGPANTKTKKGGGGGGGGGRKNENTARTTRTTNSNTVARFPPSGGAHPTTLKGLYPGLSPVGPVTLHSDA